MIRQRLLPRGMVTIKANIASHQSTSNHSQYGGFGRLELCGKEIIQCRSDIFACELLEPQIAGRHRSWTTFG
jgi:hypothetical protein